MGIAAMYYRQGGFPEYQPKRHFLVGVDSTLHPYPGSLRGKPVTQDPAKVTCKRCLNALAKQGQPS